MAKANDPRVVLSLSRVAFHPDSAKSAIPLLHPGAAAAIAPIASSLVVGSVFRPPAVSKRAYRADQRRAPRLRKGVARPGDSGHGWAICLDLDLDRTMARLGLGKPSLDGLMGDNGFWCHRSDGRNGKEAQHYNWDSFGAHGYGTAKVRERIYDLYGIASMTVADVQGLLKYAGHNPGPIDDDAGKLTRAAVRAFRLAWGLPDGFIDGQMIRCLAAVTARVEEVQATPERKP